MLLADEAHAIKHVFRTWGPFGIFLQTWSRMMQDSNGQSCIPYHGSYLTEILSISSSETKVYTFFWS